MANKNAYGVYFIFKSMEQGPSFRISVPKYPTQDPHHRILARQRSRYTHYYFYIRDEVLGPMVMRVGSSFPFQTTYYLNGHSFIEQELTRAQVGFRKNDNAFLAIDDVAALQAAADRLSPDIFTFSIAKNGMRVRRDGEGGEGCLTCSWSDRLRYSYGIILPKTPATSAQC
jgi:hypothetical protein